MNGKKSFFIILFVFIIGLVLGFFLGTKGTGFFRRGSTDTELRERFEQASRDLQSAIESQREAERRASRLQTELQGIAEQARNIEAGARSAEARAVSVAEQLDLIISESGELADGINRASGSLEESRILIDELGDIVRSLQGDG